MQHFKLCFVLLHSRAAVVAQPSVSQSSVRPWNLFSPKASGGVKMLCICLFFFKNFLFLIVYYMGGNLRRRFLFVSIWDHAYGSKSFNEHLLWTYTSDSLPQIKIPLGRVSTIRRRIILWNFKFLICISSCSIFALTQKRKILVLIVYFWPLNIQYHSEVFQYIFEFSMSFCISITAGRRGKVTKLWRIQGTFDTEMFNTSLRSFGVPFRFLTTLYLENGWSYS